MDARDTHGAIPVMREKPSREGYSDLTSPAPASGLPPLSAEQVFRDYAPRVFTMARRMVSNDMDAEDVTQDVLLQVVRKLPTFRGESAFPTWLHRVTVNAALTHRRRQAIRQERGLRNSLDVYGEDEQPFTTPNSKAMPTPDDQMLTRETRQLIEQAIDSLPQAYRVVFVLSDIEGLPNAEIAAQLNMSLPAVKSRLHRARAMLRDALSPHFEEAGV